jgi:DNA helicase-2/ATP-dependent DNA helicase PcrA
MKDICKRLQIDTKMMKERTIMSAISSAKDELISPEEYALNTFGDFKKQKIAQVYREYQAALKKSNAMDLRVIRRDLNILWWMNIRTPIRPSLN